jgi:cysteine desulfurase
MESIYLDNNATTFLLPEVADAMDECCRRGYGNPASQHAPGRFARRALEEARDGVAEILGAHLSGPDADRLVFTSGGTEANNLAIRGAAGNSPGRIVISAIEHPSVSRCAADLLRLGHEVVQLEVDASGRLRLDSWSPYLNAQTRLVSVMLANHETGVIQPVEALAVRCRETGVLLHTDATQAAGKISVNFRQLGTAALTCSAHKFHGPVGIGVLLLRSDVAIDPLFAGGSQQRGIRPGTESVVLAVGMFRALQSWQARCAESHERLQRMRDRFEASLSAAIPNLTVHGRDSARLPHVTNVSFPDVDRQAMMMALDLEGIACSTGSACASGSSEPSPVLKAMGVSDDQISSALRFAFSTLNRDADAEEAAVRIPSIWSRLRSMPSDGKRVAPSRYFGGKPV